MCARDSDKVALEFAAGDLELALEKIVQEQYPFEFIGKRILILPRKAADKLKKEFLFKCKELEIISLFHLPRKKANQIRKRHLKNLSPQNLTKSRNLLSY